MDNKSDISEIQSYITANLNEEFCVAILVTKRSKFVVHGRRCIILSFSNRSDPESDYDQDSVLSRLVSRVLAFETTRISQRRKPISHQVTAIRDSHPCW